MLTCVLSLRVSTTPFQTLYTAILRPGQRIPSFCLDILKVQMKYSVRQGQRMDCPHKEPRHYTWLTQKSAHDHSFSLFFSLKVERDEFIK